MQCTHCGNPNILTPRQIEVIEHLISHPHATEKRLAQLLDVTPNTVHKHFHEIFKRLGVSNKLACVIACQERGLLSSQKH
jgi:DNA-binding CsgD family transcriptional regulator